MKVDILTDLEREVATEYHHMIYKFLRVKNLEVADWYDVIVFGYLAGVQDYVRQNGDPKMSDVECEGWLWNRMLNARTEEIRRRLVEWESRSVSLDAENPDADDEDLFNSIPDTKNPDPAILVERLSMLQECLSLALPYEELSISLWLAGYTYDQIALFSSKSRDTVMNHVYHFRRRVRDHFDLEYKPLTEDQIKENRHDARNRNRNKEKEREYARKRREDPEYRAKHNQQSREAYARKKAARKKKLEEDSQV